MEVAPAAPAVERSRDDAKRFRVVAIIAATICVPFVIAHATVAATVGAVSSMYGDMGGEVPSYLQLIVNLAHSGVLAVLLVVLDVAIFALMYRLAKRYWIGLLFAPFFAYAAISTLLALALYVPMFNVISLVQ